MPKISSFLLNRNAIGMHVLQFVVIIVHKRLECFIMCIVVLFVTTLTLIMRADFSMCRCLSLLFLRDLIVIVKMIIYMQ